MPRSRLSPRWRRTALGISPIPACRVAPSSISGGDVSAIFRLISSGLAHRDFGKLVIDRDEVVDFRNVEEGVAEHARHALVHLGHAPGCADWPGVFTIPPSTPRLQKPCSSGGLTCIMATSRGRGPLRYRSGISERKHGVKSARPSLTACADVVADEHRVHPQVPLQSGRDVSARADGQHLGDLDIGQLSARATRASRSFCGTEQFPVRKDAVARLDGLRQPPRE